MASARGAQSDFGALPIAGKIFILVVLLTLVTAGYYGVFYLDVKERTQVARAKQGKLEGDLREARQRQKEFLARREEVVGREALDRQNLRILPEKAEIPGFLDDLNRLAELSGLSTDKILIEAEEAEELYVKVPVRLVMSGQYHQLAKFFYNVSRLERAINMENIGLRSPKVDGDEVSLEVEVRATTFRRSEAAAAKAPKAGKKGKKG